MTVLERSELQASNLSDLHAIADQLGLDGFRRLRKADLIDAILGERDGDGDAGDTARTAEPSGDAAEDSADSADSGDSGDSGDPGDSGPSAEDERPSRPRRRRLVRSRRAPSKKAEPQRPSSTARASAEDEDELGDDEGERPAAAPASAPREDTRSAGGRVAEGVVELLGNGSAFLRIAPPDPSDDDVYISAAQVRRCELVSGDRVTGPVRMPRRSERYPSLVRIDTINGASSDEVSGATRYDDLPVQWPTDRLALESGDPTLQAIEWLTPLGLGSRAVLVGPARAGKTETLRRLLGALGGREDLQVTVVLAGCRPEEIAEWQEGSVQPAVALSFAASPDSQGQAVERALDEAKRVAARGGNALVLIDGLDGMPAHVARKALVCARNLRDAGSLTLIATAAQPLGGETTVIALDVALTSTGQQPILDLVNSGTLKPELLVGEDGARAITRARAAALGAR